jgi:hypothetical protein
MDNEASSTLKIYLTGNDIACQLFPPHCHRRNTVEQAIRTFKEHFLAVLASVDPDFNMHLWDRIFPQAVLTINLVRASRLRPQPYAAAQLYGPAD